MAFNPSGDRLAVGTKAGSVFILVLDDHRPHPKTQSPLYRLQLPGKPDKPDIAMPAITDSSQRIPMMSYSPGGRCLAVASADQSIYLYAAEDDKCAPPYYGVCFLRCPVYACIENQWSAS